MMLRCRRFRKALHGKSLRCHCGPYCPKHKDEANNEKTRSWSILLAKIFQTSKHEILNIDINPQELKTITQTEVGATYVKRPKFLRESLGCHGNWGFETRLFTGIAYLEPQLVTNTRSHISPFIAGSLKHEKYQKNVMAIGDKPKKHIEYSLIHCDCNSFPVSKNKRSQLMQKNTCLCALSNSFGNSKPCCPWNLTSRLPQSFPPRRNKETKRAQQMGSKTVVYSPHSFQSPYMQWWDHWLGSARQT